MVSRLHVVHHSSQRDNFSWVIIPQAYACGIFCVMGAQKVIGRVLGGVGAGLLEFWRAAFAVCFWALIGVWVWERDLRWWALETWS